MTSSSHPALGTVQAICDKSGPAPKLYVNISYAKWTALDGPESPNRAGFWLSFDLPEGCEPFKSVFMSYEVGGSGHPPFDGRQFNGEAPGGFGVPHSDIRTPRAAAASALCVPRRPARPVPKLTSLASGRGRR